MPRPKKRRTRSKAEDLAMEYDLQGAGCSVQSAIQ
jgi:hypothetical protein